VAVLSRTSTRPWSLSRPRRPSEQLISIRQVSAPPFKQAPLAWWVVMWMARSNESQITLRYELNSYKKPILIICYKICEFLQMTVMS
jgi:hypothetical protein